MRPSVVLETRRNAVRDAFTRYPVANPRVFGSVARGEDEIGSDVDVLVDALPGATLFDLSGLAEDLHDLLGVRVDVLTTGGLSGRLRSRILADAIQL